MKRLLATTLLVGYATLVPFCFFGGVLVANMDHTNMVGDPAHQMSDCGMPLGGCAHTMEPGALDTAVHHISMYLSITQTPLAMFSLIMAVLVLLYIVILGISYNWLRTFFAKTFSHIPLSGVDDPHIKTKREILRWLSLFETSPNFA